MMSHEKLDVYQCAIKFIGFSLPLLAEIPRGYAPLADQLKRAAMSIPLQIAEGAGKRSQADCRRFFDYARGSAMECAAVLGVMREMKFCRARQLEDGKVLLDRVAAMLTKLAGRSVSAAAPLPPESAGVARALATVCDGVPARDSAPASASQSVADNQKA